MKTFAAFILLVFVSSSQSVIMYCSFSTNDWGPSIGFVYTCWSSLTNIGNSTVIEKFISSHSNGRRDSDVLFVRERSQVQFIPTNLVIFFPKLKGIFIDAPLLRVPASDLKPFPSLVLFYSMHGKLTRLDGNLF